MKVCDFILRLAGSVILAAAALAPAAAHAAHSHAGYFPNGYVDARTCLVCHKSAADEVMDSVHYRWRTANADVEFPGGGEHGMIDRACGLVGSNAIINFDESCGQCHVANALPFPDPATGQYTYAQKTGVYCLICHAAEGMWDANGDGVVGPEELAGNGTRVYDAALGREVWYVDRSRRAAESVGGPVSNEACLRCHEHGLEDYHYKRGTPYEPETDVHAEAGVLCTACHTVVHHKIARGNRVTDMFANELPEVDVRCENCHGATPHPDAQLNAHTDKIGCETCHIPEVMGTQRRIWAATLGVDGGAESAVPVLNSQTGRYEPYSAYDPGLVAPSYRWYAGQASMLAEPIAEAGAWNMQPATRETPGAKILPFRQFISGQPMDGAGLPGTPGFNENFTMLAALTQMAPLMKQAGMMRPEGLSAAEAAMMGQFPNMLYFDRTEYFTHGNVKAAISIGMAKLGAALQGMDVSRMSREGLIAMGDTMWSGQVAGLDLPDNPYAPGYQPGHGPTEVTGSFITVSHAIRKHGALSCGSCHVPNGRMDFVALGYSPERQLVLSSLANASARNWLLYE